LHPGAIETGLPHTQEWELYHNSFSLCSKKVRVCLAELDLPYASHHIHLIETGCYENVGHRYLAVNPAGLVPVLVHEGRPIYESHDEIAYAASRAGDRGRELLPPDPEVRGLVERWIDCASLVGKNPIQATDRRAGHCIPGLTLPIFTTMVRHIPYREILKGLLSHPNKQRPLIFAALKFRGIRGLRELKPAMKLLRRSRRDMGAHLEALAGQLARHGGPWIAGDRFTLADVSWVVLLDRLVEADWDGYFWGGGRNPGVAAYWQRLRERPSYASEIEAVRCPSTRRGIADLKRAKAEDARFRELLEAE
jgi:glutathione S-transferase